MTTQRPSRAPLRASSPAGQRPAGQDVHQTGETHPSLETSTTNLKFWLGTALLVLYVAYLIYTVLAAAERPILQRFTTVMLWFVTPLSVLTLSTVVHQIGRRGSATAQG